MDINEGVRRLFESARREDGPAPEERVPSIAGGSYEEPQRQAANEQVLPPAKNENTRSSVD
jgi:hypothetical protein